MTDVEGSASQAEPAKILPMRQPRKRKAASKAKPQGKRSKNGKKPNGVHEQYNTKGRVPWTPSEFQRVFKTSPSAENARKLAASIHRAPGAINNVWLFATGILGPGKRETDLHTDAVKYGEAASKKWSLAERQYVAGIKRAWDAFHRSKSKSRKQSKPSKKRNRKPVVKAQVPAQV